MSTGAAELTEQLRSDDPQQRELAAEYLSDLLQDQSLSQREHNVIGAALVGAAMIETSMDARESQLNALGTSFELTFTTVAPLIALMESLEVEQLRYCLAVLAATHDPAAEPTIASYAGHADERVRSEAREALIELAGRR